MENKIRLNGPYAAYLTEYAGIKYIFLSDIHVNTQNDPTSLGNACEKCSIIDDDCTDTVNLLNDIFLISAKKNKGVGFFYELPFRKTDKIIEFKTSEAEEFRKIEKFYRNCIVKNSTCKFKNVLFHNLDIRFQIINQTSEEYTKKHGKKYFLPEYIQNFLMDNFFSNDLYTLTELGYEFYIMNKLSNLVEMIKRKEFTESYKLKRLIEQILLENINGENIGYKLYQLYLTSNDIENDVFKLFKNIDIENKKEILIPDSMIVKRNGKTIHRIKAQIDALSNDGKEFLAKKIVSYFLNGYKTLSYTLIPRFKDIINSLNIVEQQIKQVEGEYNKSLYIEYFNKINESIKLLTLGLINNHMLMMDAYSLSRMFRNFTVPESNIKITKKIIYTGGDHINRYIHFFEKILGTKIKKYEDNPLYKRCVNVDVEDYKWMLD